MDSLKKLIQLKSQVKKLSLSKDDHDAIVKWVELIIRREFGDLSIYLGKLKAIRFYPKLYLKSNTLEIKESIYESAKNQLITLLELMIEEIKIHAKTEKEYPTGLIKNDIIMNNQLFVVHGQNEEMKHSLARFLEKLNLAPIILNEKPDQGDTIIEKFIKWSDVKYAIVILSADDYGYLKTEDPKNKKPRARQNVIFELGYFMGKIGRQKVICLKENVKDMELPSDFFGILYINYDQGDEWKIRLMKELRSAEIEFDMNALIK